jgi:lipid A 4'-phosphatase
MDQTISLAPATTGGGYDPAGAVVRRLRRIAAQARVRIRSRAAGVRLDDPVTAALAAVGALSVWFLVFPGVDPMVSDLFHGTEGFVLAQDPILKALRKSSTLALAAALVAILTLLVQRAIGDDRGGRARTRRMLFLLAGLALGPGLAVNTILKQGWGRARPIQTDLFGGEDAFSGVWRISDACQNNCSFVSGEASSSAWMVCAVVMLVPRRWRRRVVGPVVVYAVALSLNRIAFGGHYLSDVLLSWAITALVLAGLYRLMVARPARSRPTGRQWPALATGH